jgi:hypothetical protein
MTTRNPSLPRVLILAAILLLPAGAVSAKKKASMPSSSTSNPLIASGARAFRSWVWRALPLSSCGQRE